MQHIHPVKGWSLNHIVALDAQAPGTAGYFLRASDERRQVIASHLAVQPFPKQQSQQAALAAFLTRAAHQDILQAAFGDVPQGLRGALRRSGPQPHEPLFYRLLFRLLSSKAHASSARVIKRLSLIDPLRLRVTRILPEKIRSARLIAAIPSARVAGDVATLFDLFSSNGIDRKTLAEALDRVESESQLAALWVRWSHKLKLPAHPVPASTAYKPVASGAELHRIALRYRNCVRRYLSEVMQRQCAFAEFEFERRRCVVHLSGDGNRWKLEGLFAKENGPVDWEVRSCAEAYLRTHGVRIDAPRHRDGEWSVLRRMTGVQLLLM